MNRALYLLPLLVLLSACGQRGDLYFPSEEREAVLTVPAQLPPAASPATPEENADDTSTPPGATVTPDPASPGR